MSNESHCGRAYKELCLHKLRPCMWRQLTDCCSQDITDGKCFVRFCLNNTVVGCVMSALHLIGQSINQSIAPPDCKMDERKQQPQIDHCFHSAAGQNESCACWEVRAEGCFTPWAPLDPPTPHPPPAETPKHDSDEFEFGSDSLEGADGVITKWRGETMLLLCDHLAAAAGSLHLAGCYQSLIVPFW